MSIVQKCTMAHSKEILDKYLSQNVGRKTRGLFAEWISAPVDEELKDQILQDHWEREYYLSPEDIEKSYKAVQKRIGHSKPRKHKTLHWVGAAAVMLVVLFLSVLGIASLFQTPSSDVDEYYVEMTECYVGNGEKQLITLSDSTSVILNSGSLLIYPKEFVGNQREVYLTGEAIFDVSKDEEHSFIVKTPDFSVKVHGTLFNVSSYPDAECSFATLKEGSVSVIANGNKEYLLSPNHTLCYSKDSHKVTVVQSDVADIFSWKDGCLCFKSASIHSIIETIERYYGVRVYLTTGKYDSALVTAKFIHGESVEELFSALCLVIPGMKYKVENNSIYIK